MIIEYKLVKCPAVPCFRPVIGFVTTPFVCFWGVKDKTYPTWRSLSCKQEVNFTRLKELSCQLSLTWFLFIRFISDTRWTSA